MQHAQTLFGSGWKPEPFVKMPEVFANVPTFRIVMQSLTWQRSMTQSNIRFLEILEGVMVGSLYDEQLRIQVNNDRAPADYHTNMPDLKKRNEYSVLQPKRSFLERRDKSLRALRQSSPPAK